jgi:type IV pilus assembly protein PilW
MTAGINGLNDVGASTTISGSSIAATAGTDVLLVRRNLDNGVRVVKNNSSAQIFVEVTSTEANACADGTDKISGLCKGDILMVSDCTKSRIFQTGNLSVTGGGGGPDELNVTHPSSGTPGNDPTSWGGSSGAEEERFGEDAEIIKIGNYAYFIGTGASGESALYRKEGTAAAQELVEGVENMQILYGQDTDSDNVANYYVHAGQVTDMEEVISVRITLTVVSDDNITQTDQTHSISGATDNRLRHTFTSTIGIRNRLQ